MPIRTQFKISEKNMLLSGGIGRCRAKTPTREGVHISLLKYLVWAWKVCEWRVDPPLGWEVEWSGGRCVPAIIKYFLACWALSKAGYRHLVENQTDVVPVFMRFPRQEHWSELPSPSPGDLPDPGIKPTSPALAGGFFMAEPPGKTQSMGGNTLIT